MTEDEKEKKYETKLAKELMDVAIDAWADVIEKTPAEEVKAGVLELVMDFKLKDKKEDPDG